jgi:hypothetical protein
MEHTVTRREALRAIGIGGAASLAGCTQAARSLTGGSELERQLETVRSATAQYDGSPELAMEDGYALLGPIVPGMGWHFLNEAYVGHAVENGFTLERPQLITYDEHFDLGAVEWGAPAGAVPEQPDLLATDEAEWTIHQGSTHLFATEDDEVTPPPEADFGTLATDDHWMEFHPPDEGIEPGDTVTEYDFTKDGEPDERVIDAAISHPDLNTLHVWLFAENPDGRFAAVHPEFAQVGGEGHGDEHDT